MKNANENTYLLTQLALTSIARRWTQLAIFNRNNLGKIIISGRWAMSKQQVKSHQEVIPIKYCKLGPPPRNRSQSQLSKKVSIFIRVLHFIYIWSVSFIQITLLLLGKIIISESWVMSKQQVTSHQEVIPIKYCKLGPPPRNRRQSQLGRKVSIFISVLHFIYIWRISLIQITLLLPSHARVSALKSNFH